MARWRLEGKQRLLGWRRLEGRERLLGWRRLEGTDRLPGGDGGGEVEMAR